MLSTGVVILFIHGNAEHQSKTNIVEIDKHPCSAGLVLELVSLSHNYLEMSYD